MLEGASLVEVGRLRVTVTIERVSLGASGVGVGASSREVVDVEEMLDRSAVGLGFVGASGEGATAFTDSRIRVIQATI